MGEQCLPSRTAAIIVTFVPFWFALFDRKQWSYYFSHKFILLGLLLGFIGVVVLTNFANQDTASLNRPGHAAFGVTAVLLGGIAWTIGSLFSKYTTTNSSLLMNGSIQMLATSIVCIIVSLATGEFRSFSVAQFSSQSMYAFVYLIFMGSIVAYLSYLYLLGVRPAVQVSTTCV